MQTHSLYKLIYTHIIQGCKELIFPLEFLKSISVKNYSGKIIKILFVISLVQGCGSELLTVNLDPISPSVP